MSQKAAVCIKMPDELPPDPAKQNDTAVPASRGGTAFRELQRQLDGIQETSAACLVETQELLQRDALIADLQRQNGQFRERFHEREVLRPVWLMLIGILDRCLEQQRELDQLSHSTSDRELTGTIRRLAESRRADRLEIEAALAAFGVVAFRHGGETFDPRHQQCRRRIRCDNAELHERITHRVFPGYRRDDWIVRPERVDVLVHAKS